MANQQNNQNIVETFIKNVMNERKNEAKENLEKILKIKTARRIKETLAS